MHQVQSLDLLRPFERPGRLRFDAGRGGLTRAQISTPWSAAEIYLHGAQVTAFKKHAEAPLLFLSEGSYFAPGKPIRGGIPICFPWFGPRAGDVAHGFARITDWFVTEATVQPSGGVVLRLILPEGPARSSWPPFTCELLVSMTDRLTLDMIVTNRAAQEPFEFENCFHTYFAVGDIGAVSIVGLPSNPDSELSPSAAGADPSEPLRIQGHTDRAYLDTPGPLRIHDPVLHRRIDLEKSGSQSTVVWNPWTTQALADFVPDEYRHMLCVESGNIGRNRISLAPGASTSMKVTLASQLL